MPLSAQARADAHEQIRQIAARYSHGVDRLNEAVMKSAYWPDAIDDHGVFVGNAMEFCAMVVASHRRFDSTLHCNFNHLIEITSDTQATGEIYNVAYIRSTVNGHPVLDTWFGRYIDNYECRNGEWRIRHRVCVHEGTKRETVTETMPIDAAKFRQGSADRGVI